MPARSCIATSAFQCHPDQNGVAKIVDFGLARLAHHGQHADHGYGGNAGYMSPEQTFGRMSISEPHLVVGIVLAEMVTRKIRFSGDAAATVFAILKRAAACNG